MLENPNPYESPKALAPVAKPQRDGWDRMILAGAVSQFLGSLGLLGGLSLLILF